MDYQICVRYTDLKHDISNDMMETKKNAYLDDGNGMTVVEMA